MTNSEVDSGANLGANLGDVLPLPTARPELTQFLQNRRSNLAKIMTDQGPSAEDVDVILDIAARVPDHRKLAPWRFIIFQGDMRAQIGQSIRAAFEVDCPDAPDERKAFEAARLMRAPIVIAVVSAPIDCPRGTPKWEQALSAGAVCYNMLLAAQSLGYGAQWLTEWFAYDSSVTKAMGLTPTERIAGFIYIGHVKEAPTERARPDVKNKVTFWTT